MSALKLIVEKENRSKRILTILDGSGLPLHIQPLMMFCFTLEMPNYIVINTCQVSKPTYISLKSRFLKNIKDEEDHQL